MSFYKKIIYWLPMTLIGLILSGCAQDQFKGSLPSNYQFSANKPNEGVAAFTVACSIKDGTVNMPIYTENTNQAIGEDLLLISRTLTFECSSQDQFKLQTRLMNLPAGTYILDQWYISKKISPFESHDTLSGKDFPTLTFKVLPHKVTDLGGIVLTQNYHHKYNIRFLVPHEAHIEQIKNMLPDVTKKDIIIAPMKISKPKSKTHIF